MKQLISIVLLVFSITGIYGQGYWIDTLTVDISISDQGMAQVHEHYSVFFETKKRGIIRSMPYRYTFDNNQYSIKFRDVKVPNEATHSSNKRGNKLIRIGEKTKYLTGQKSYDIYYEVVGPFIRAEEYDEFYWNVTGPDWDTEIKHLNFSVSLPADTPLRYNDVRFFTGKAGSNGKDAEVKTDGTNIYGSSTKPIPSGSALSLAIKLPKGFVKSDSFLQLNPNDQKQNDYGNWWLIPIALFTSLLGWWKGLRPKYDKTGDAVAITYPPKNFSPAEVGTFIDNVAHNRDILSLLPYWAFLGFITITRTSKTDLIFQKKKVLSDDRPNYEHTFFNAIFEENDQVSLSEINAQMYQTISAVKQAITADLRQSGLYDDRYMYWFKSWRIIVLGFAFLVGGIIGIALGNPPLGIVSATVAIGCFVLRLIHPPASERGHAIRSKLKGLRKHLEDTSSSEENLAMDNNYFERLFPFAFALGLEKSWLTKTSTRQNFHPVWYGVTPGIQHDPTFNDFTEIFKPKEINSAFNQYPASASTGSSGGFSGGSSGGGFGGGGGSSW